MSRKFDEHRGMRIDNVKAHHIYLKPKKPNYTNYETPEDEYDYLNDNKPPWEIKHVKGLAAGKPKINLKKEKIFDTTGDGKPFVKKKESKKEKDSRAFLMMDGKKYHSIGSKPLLD
jgi:hypothetical protein